MVKSHHIKALGGAGPWRQVYESWLSGHAPQIQDSSTAASDAGEVRSVGIVGTGMAGLYSALLLTRQGVTCHLFEAHPTRIGGRIYTHRFNDEANQYFEAGAMRVPDTPVHQPVFDLIDWLNQQVEPDAAIQTIPYHLYQAEGNLVYVNGVRGNGNQTLTVAEASADPARLKFSLPPEERDKSAAQMLAEVLAPYVEALSEDFEAGFRQIIKYDNYSLHTYLTEIEGWSVEKCNYVETMTSASNQFHLSFTELVIENKDFAGSAWKTIADGMDRLPNGCAAVLGKDRFTLGATVRAVRELPDGSVAIEHSGSSSPAIFDKVILAIPPAALRMIETPQWDQARAKAIRALHYEALYKIGLRFKSRFWEKVRRPSRGGQSITDLPSRWCVYPSYGIGDDGPGVLLMYSWMSDAYAWLPQQAAERERLALRDLQTLYGDEVDVRAEFIESFAVAWPNEWSTGDAKFLPGQFRTLFHAARANAGNVHFAGEHLSVHHTWIVGALDSALHACRQVLNDATLTGLRPRKLAPEASAQLVQSQQASTNDTFVNSSSNRMVRRA